MKAIHVALIIAGVGVFLYIAYKLLKPSVSGGVGGGGGGGDIKNKMDDILKALGVSPSTPKKTGGGSSVITTTITPTPQPSNPNTASNLLYYIPTGYHTDYTLKGIVQSPGPKVYNF